MMRFIVKGDVNSNNGNNSVNMSVDMKNNKINFDLARDLADTLYEVFGITFDITRDLEDTLYEFFGDLRGRVIEDDSDFEAYCPDGYHPNKISAIETALFDIWDSNIFNDKVMAELAERMIDYLESTIENARTSIISLNMEDGKYSCIVELDVDEDEITDTMLYEIETADFENFYSVCQMAGYKI